MRVSYKNLKTSATSHDRRVALSLATTSLKHQFACLAVNACNLGLPLSFLLCYPSVFDLYRCLVDTASHDPSIFPLWCPSSQSSFLAHQITL